jgi:hypothetical protein
MSFTCGSFSPTIVLPKFSVEGVLHPVTSVNHSTSCKPYVSDMALWEGSLQGLDPLTRSTVLQLYLEDAEELASKVKGKGREGTISDGELALQMYTDELNACHASLTDQKMAQSIALAIIRDAQFIHQENAKEQQIAQDRDFAASLQAGNSGPKCAHPHQSKEEAKDTNIWEDPEM